MKTITTFIKITTIFLIFIAYSFSLQADPIDELNFIDGPTSVNLLNRAAMNIDTDHLYLNVEDTAKFHIINQNISNADNNTILNKDWTWAAYFMFLPDGYVKDNKSYKENDIDPKKLLKSMNLGNDLANEEKKKKGWPQLRLKGWLYKPRYNNDTKQLEWAFLIEGEDGKQIANYYTKILGKNGHTSVALVSDPSTLNKNIKDLKQALNTFSYNNGERYSDFKQGDRVAEYGLAALVAGGAAAVATKKGFWALIAGFFGVAWKFIGIIFLLMLTKIGSIFRWLKSLFTNK